MKASSPANRKKKEMAGLILLRFVFTGTSHLVKFINVSRLLSLFNTND